MISFSIIRRLSPNCNVQISDLLLTNKKIRSYSKKPIIWCKRPEFNHFDGQTYSKFDGVPLASKGWLHDKSKGDYFIIHTDINKTAKDSASSKSFEDVSINPIIIDTMKEFGILNPTKIQVKAIPSLLAGNNTLITAETGCGKTLSYILPILQKLIHWKSLNIDRDLNCPFALVITPTRELAQQIGEVAGPILDKFSLKTNILTGGKTKRKMLNPSFDECDLLVASLGALSKLVTTGIYKIKHVHHLVLDEADTLLDDSFSDKLSYLLRKFDFYYATDPNCVPPRGCQLTLVSATMPVEMPQILNSFIDPESIKTVSTSNLHKILPHVPQKFMRLGKIQKPLELLKLVKHDVQKKNPVMIFSNKTSTCDWVSLFLNENNIECLNINGRMTVDLKTGKFNSFVAGKVNVLSCTDIASRGVDTVKVKHIINYDFPLYTADYIHRCGRTGRVGSPENCHVTNFVAWPREVELVQKIETSIRKMNNLPSVNGNIGRLIQNRIENLELKALRAISA